MQSITMYLEYPAGSSLSGGIPPSAVTKSLWWSESSCGRNGNPYVAQSKYEVLDYAEQLSNFGGFE